MTNFKKCCRVGCDSQAVKRIWIPATSQSGKPYTILIDVCTEDYKAENATGNAVITKDYEKESQRIQTSVSEDQK